MALRINLWDDPMNEGTHSPVRSMATYLTGISMVGFYLVELGILSSYLLADRYCMTDKV